MDGAPLTDFQLLPGFWSRRGPSRSSVVLDVVSVPGQVTLEAIFDMGRGLKFVVFAGVDDQFGGAVEALQGLVHLLAAKDGDVPVDLAMGRRAGADC